MRYIELTKGYTTIVDDSDYDVLCKYKWHAMDTIGRVVAARVITNEDYTRTLQLLHRVIMIAPPELEVDHINGNTLDNRRSNLRLCTHQENCMNASVAKHSSKFKGVSRNVTGKKWVAQIRYNNRLIYLGSFESEESAAKAYNVKASELFGEFARLNEVCDA